MATIAVDTPITKPDEDLFGRQNIVNLISTAILNKSRADHECYTIGVYGKWGEGKTSVLNMIEFQLLNNMDDDILIVKFNPWLFKDQESLIINFFNAISKESPFRQFAKQFKEYSSLIAYGGGALASIVSSAPEFGVAIYKSIKRFGKSLPNFNLSIESRKKELAKVIKESKKHILIIIDDIDRLDKSEMHALFKLIKQNADFENIAYLLAMDVEMVAKSIGDRFGGGGKSDGHDFIDKIVQVPILLPQVQPSYLRQILGNQLKVIFNELAQTNEKESLNISRGEIVEHIAPLFKSNRDIIRYINQLQFTLFALYGEINIIDLCLLESLKIFNYEGYIAIMNNRDFILGAEFDIRKVLQPEYEEIEKKRKEEFIESILTRVPAEILAPMKSIIQRQLFLSWLLNSTNQSREEEKRLCSKAYFDKYFMGCSPDNVISDAELNKVMDLLNEDNYNEISCFFDSVLSRYDWEEVKRAAYFLIKEDNDICKRSAKAKRVAIAISLMSVNNEVRYNAIQEGECVEVFVSHVIMMRNMFLQPWQKRKFDCKTMEETVRIILDRASLYYAVMFARNIVNHDMPVADIKKIDLINTLIRRIFAEKGEDEIFKFSKHVIEPLFEVWKQSNKDEFKAFIRRKISEKTFNIAAFVTKWIENTNDAKDYLQFIRLFECKEDIYRAIKSRVPKKEQIENDAINTFVSKNKKVDELG